MLNFTNEEIIKLQASINSDNDNEVIRRYEISPDMAKQLITRTHTSGKQRQTRDSIVKKYQNLILKNQWKSDVKEPIVVDQNLNVLDGLHRLNAIVCSERSLKMYVTQTDNSHSHFVSDGVSKSHLDRTSIKYGMFNDQYLKKYRSTIYYIKNFFKRYCHDSQVIEFNDDIYAEEIYSIITKHRMLLEKSVDIWSPPVLRFETPEGNLEKVTKGVKVIRNPFFTPMRSAIFIALLSGIDEQILINFVNNVSCLPQNCTGNERSVHEHIIKDRCSPTDNFYFILSALSKLETKDMSKATNKVKNDSRGCEYFAKKINEKFAKPCEIEIAAE